MTASTESRKVTPITLQAPSAFTLEIPPTTALEILDHHLRRVEGSDRAVGLLFGSRSESTAQIRVSSAFALAFTEDDQLDLEHMRQIVEMHAPLKIVGWYATLPVDNRSFELNEKICREISVWPVVHLSVDIPQMEFCAFIDAPVGDDVRLGTLMHPIPFSCVGLEQMVKVMTATQTPRDSRFEVIGDCLTELQSMLAEAKEYVGNVLSGKIQGSPAVAEHLVKVVVAVPLVDSQSLNECVDRRLNEMVMAAHVSNIAKSQIKISQNLLESGAVPKSGSYHDKNQAAA
eukprot:Partr_v1_DN24531_c0_g1_i1_m19565 putative Component of the eukaryotic translation initiation factor 3 (eIF-3) complex, which is involved in protein synthesis and, together with other initiation factors, stimulates binding of mRNA and methionyl-tRNAi to the 40S ribosome (By similarity)